ncbi:MAG: glycerol-3-phosphate dehydrogenase C-terminal domain-containing protein [Allorhizobium sp.]
MGGETYSPNLFIQLVQQYGVDDEVATHLARTYGDQGTPARPHARTPARPHARTPARPHALTPARPHSPPLHCIAR